MKRLRCMKVKCENCGEKIPLYRLKMFEGLCPLCADMVNLVVNV